MVVLVALGAWGVASVAASLAVGAVVACADRSASRTAVLEPSGTPTALPAMVLPAAPGHRTLAQIS